MTLRAGTAGAVSATAERRLAPDGAWEHTSGGSAVGRCSFEHCARIHRANLYRYAFWLCGDRNAAEDAVQEALIRAWRSWSKLEDKGAVKAWLCTIVRRECARMFQRKQPVMRDLNELADAEQGVTAMAEEAAATAELRRAIAALDDTYREPLVLQVLMGYTAAEIAGILGVKPGAVLTRLHRTRQKLSAGLEAA